MVLIEFMQNIISLIKKLNYKQNPLILFLPFLFLYLIIIILFSKDILVGDEGRHLFFAKNLIKGCYSPPRSGINLSVGPGYPIILMPLVLLNLPLIYLKILNAFFLYLAIILFYKTLTFYLKRKTTLLFAFLLGLYFPLYQELPFILTETFSFFLVTLFMFCYCCLFQRKRAIFIEIIFASVLLAYLALTKVIFGYVILVGIFLFMTYSFIKRLKKVRLTALIFMLAMLFCIPYLIYTYSLTGKIFYWCDTGGDNLYWMSTPYENEFGDWNVSRFDKFLDKKQERKEFLEKIPKLNRIERDEAYKREAIKNIKSYPEKYAINWLANIGRIFFSYPYSYKKQSFRTYFTIIPNMFIVVLGIIFSYITFINRKKISLEIFLLLIFISIYLFGNSLVSDGRRVLFLALPIIGLWLAYVFDNFIQIKLYKNLQ